MHDAMVVCAPDGSVYDSVWESAIKPGALYELPIARGWIYRDREATALCDVRNPPQDIVGGVAQSPARANLSWHATRIKHTVMGYLLAGCRRPG